MFSNCKHKSSLSKEWLPSNNGILKLHPYCEVCGIVKNVSVDKGKRIGYFANVLSTLKKDLKKRGYKISKVQIRLILSELEKINFDDVYSISFSKQKEIFLNIVSKYIRVSKEKILEYL